MIGRQGSFRFQVLIEGENHAIECRLLFEVRGIVHICQTKETMSHLCPQARHCQVKETAIASRAAGRVSCMRIYSKEGYAPFRDYVTWYRITGDPDSKMPPVVILHGGPGAAHDYVDAYKLLARYGRRVIHYDQLGCGKSTLLPGK